MRAALYEKKYFDNSALFATMVEESFAAAGRQVMVSSNVMSEYRYSRQRACQVF